MSSPETAGRPAPSTTAPARAPDAASPVPARPAGTVRFIHSADWQLGMTRHFLGPDAQPRFAQARIDAIRRIGEAARAHDAEFVVVSGDVFETNQVSTQTVRRALHALGSVPVPVFLLPGNHDPLDAGSVFRSTTFQRGRPANVTVLEDATVHLVRPGVEVVGAPWFSKRPLTDLVADACAGLVPDASVRRVLVAHGAADDMIDLGNPAIIRLAAVEQALAEHRIDYLALGDRHSTTSVGGTGRVWYAGAPEPTDYDETDAGNALLVELGPERSAVDRLLVGTWRFALGAFDLDGPEDLAPLDRWLDAFEHKDRTIVKLVLRGTISLTVNARLDDLLDRYRDLLGALEEWQRHRDVVIRPDDDDFADLALTGFAQTAVERLRAMVEAGGAQAATARDALGLLVRLASRGGTR